MNTFKLSLLGAWLVAPVLAANPADAPAPAGVQLQVVKYRELCQAVRALRGKIVVVDVWAEFWLPCKKEFPHLVEMHKKYGKDGVVCLSVSVDPNEKDSKDAALEFLKKQGATFGNYLLDEDSTVWGEKLDMSGPPAVFVFDRANRRVGKFDYSDPDKQYTYDDIDKLVRQLLGQ